MRELLKDILEKELVTSEEAARIIDVEASTIRHLVRRGKIESVKRGGVRLFDIQDMEKLK